MSTGEWRERWVNTLIKAGISPVAAEAAFEVCYGNQELDLTENPENIARTFIPALPDRGIHLS